MTDAEIPSVRDTSVAMTNEMKESAVSMGEEGTNAAPSGQEEPFAAPVSEEEAKPLAPRYLRDNKGFKVWLQAVNTFYQTRCKRFDSLSSLKSNEKEQLKARLRRAFIIVSAFENTRGFLAVLLVLAAVVLGALFIIALSGGVFIKVYMVTVGSEALKVAVAICSIPTAAILLLSLLYVSIITPNVFRVTTLQQFVISLVFYFLLTRFTNNLTLNLVFAIASLIVFPLRIGLRKTFVRYFMLVPTATTGVVFWAGSYGAVMSSVADGLVVAAGLIFVASMAIPFIWSGSERKAHRRYPAEFIIDKLCQALAAYEKLENAEAPGDVTVNTIESGRKPVVTMLKDVAALLTGALPKALAVSESTVDAQISSEFKACAASIRGVAIAVAVPRESDAALDAIRRLFVWSVAEEWGAFKQLAPAAEAVALEKRVAVGQVMLHVAMVLVAVGGIYFLEIVKPSWLAVDFRNAAAIPLVIFAIQQLVSVFDQRATDNGINILRSEAEGVFSNR